MDLIPVIDLMGGQVVRAVAGRRAAYRPIRSALCADPAPLAVAARLLDYTAAATLYVADLDALTGGRPQLAQLAALAAALPEVDLWLDAGFTDRAAFETVRRELGAAERITPVFASESLASAEAAREALADREHAVLSLDRLGEPAGAAAPADRAACWATPLLWPRRVIVMTLERVGAFAGPDLATLSALAARAPDCRFYGAGGIRDAADLAAAEHTGAAGWLVASALHDRRLPPAPKRPPFSA